MAKKRDRLTYDCCGSDVLADKNGLGHLDVFDVSGAFFYDKRRDVMYTCFGLTGSLPPGMCEKDVAFDIVKGVRL